VSSVSADNLPEGKYKESCKGCFAGMGKLACHGCLKSKYTRTSYGKPTSIKLGGCVFFGTSDGVLTCDKTHQEDLQEQKREKFGKHHIQKKEEKKQQHKKQQLREHHQGRRDYHEQWQEKVSRNLPSGSFEKSCYNCKAANGKLACKNCFRTDRSAGTAPSSMMIGDCAYIVCLDGQLACERQKHQRPQKRQPTPRRRDNQPKKSVPQEEPRRQERKMKKEKRERVMRGDL